MDRVGLDDIEREIDSEARERFPGGAVRQVVLLQYGDDPEIEPGDLWVRVLLAADGPDDYERSVQAFQHDHGAAMEETVAGLLAGRLRLLVHRLSRPINPLARAFRLQWRPHLDLRSRGLGVRLDNTGARAAAGA